MAANFDIKFNTVELVDAAEEAFQSVNEALGVQFTRRITGNIWDWPTPEPSGTPTGSLPEEPAKNPHEPSPRDIVDLGQLRDSYKGPNMLEPTLAEHSWPTEYAMAVHEGARFADGRSMPARPWTTRTIKEWDVANAYTRLARVLMRKKAPP